MFVGVMGQEATEQNGLSGELHMVASAMLSHSKRMYSKDFLLSIAELEECKRVPAGLDSSLLRETQPKLDEKGVAIPGVSSRGLIRTMRENDAHSESPPDLPEWRRPSSLPGSPFLKPGPRQAESKIPSPRPGPARAGNNPARSIMGRSGSARWELRSNGDDRDRDGSRTQFEWELSSPTESGGRLHNRGLARSGLVVSQEHDGLLGSGGPIVHRGMIQTPTHERHRAERTGRIGRAGELYHSTRGGKASRNFPITQHSRRVDTDSISDETFGSDDWPNGERSEQERQRRDEFEQMRKELRNKPLNTARNYNDIWLVESSQSTETFISSSPGTPQSSSSKDDILKPHNKHVATSSTPRLLVPPGFSKPIPSKIGSPKENHEAAKSHSSHMKDDDSHALNQTSSDDGTKLDNEDHFNSLLMKLNQFEDENQKTFSPSQSPMMSKFARWFPSQGPNLNESGSNSEPLNVVTKSEDLGLHWDSSSAQKELAGSCENNFVSKLSSVTSLIPTKSKGSVLPMPVGPSLEDVEKVMTAGADVCQDVRSEEEINIKIHSMLEGCHLLLESDHAVINDAAQVTQILDSQRPPVKDVPAKKTGPVFLTCEDLEQSLLSESTHHPKLEDTSRDMDDNVNLMQLLQLGSSKREGRSKGQGLVAGQGSGDVMDGSASMHLMSLLQKNDGRASPLGDSSSTISAEPSVHLKGLNDNVEDQGNTTEIISLETLFGRKFLNELRSVGEPVSSKQIVDDSIPVGKEDTLFNSVIIKNEHPRRPGHAEVAFHEEAGWKYDGRIVVEPKDSGITSGSDLQGNCSTDVSAHVHSPMKASKNSPSSRGVIVNGASFGDFKQRKVSHHPYQPNYTHGPHHEGHRHPASEIPSHRLHFERPIKESHVIHESSLYTMGTYAPNSLLYPFQEEFLRAGNRHMPGHFEEGPSGLAGGYRVPASASAGYPESIQMGFNPSQGVPDPRMGCFRISPLADRWFPGDHIQASQGVAGFNPYQHHVIQERKSGSGVSGLGGLGPGVQSYNIGLPSEIAYDQYTLPSGRPNYG